MFAETLPEQEVPLEELATLSEEHEGRYRALASNWDLLTIAFQRVDTAYPTSMDLYSSVASYAEDNQVNCKILSSAVMAAYELDIVDSWGTICEKPSRSRFLRDSFDAVKLRDLRKRVLEEGQYEGIDAEDWTALEKTYRYIPD